VLRMPAMDTRCHSATMSGPANFNYTSLCYRRSRQTNRPALPCSVARRHGRQRPRPRISSTASSLAVEGLALGEKTKMHRII
jgi:hypothetical protein